MKSDLTCPVEVVSVAIHTQADSEADIVCVIDFYNLSDRVIDSIQMNIVCFDADDVRLGGRLVRAGAHGEARTNFSGTFMPEHVAGTARVEASVEKVWYQDGVLWRREERNVHEYTPNILADGRERDRLRAVAGPDAAGYAREEDALWLCVCGRANRNSDDCCLRCGRAKEYVLKAFSFAAIDATQGRKERLLAEKTKESLRKSSEQTVRQMRAEQKKQKKRRRRLTAAVAALAVLAGALALGRWGVPYGVCAYASMQLKKGQLMRAESLYAWVGAHWPDEFGAGEGVQKTGEGIVDGLILRGTEDALLQAQARASALGDGVRESRAALARAQLLADAGDTDAAEELLASRPSDAAAQGMLTALSYQIAARAKERLDYPTAIARFAALGAYEDAEAQLEDSIFLYGRQLMREEKYEQACEQFIKVTGVSDAVALLRQCRYALAQQKQDAGAYEEAAQLYESLGVYEAAETQGKFCRYTAGMNALAAGDLAHAAEQLALAEDYKDAAERFADTALTLGFAALNAGEEQEAIGWLERVARTAEVDEAINRAVYAGAEKLEKDGQREAAAQDFASLGSYRDAAERADALQYVLALDEMGADPAQALIRLEALGDYKDAAQQAVRCRYALAQAAREAGELEEAIDRFAALGDYNDAAQQTVICRYALAKQYLAQERYDAAAMQFEACGAYLDAGDMVLASRYQKAAAAFAAGDYPQAAKLFAALGSYEDAKKRTEQSEDAWLQSVYTGAKMDMELGDYASVVSALEAYADADLPARYGDIPQMFEQACLSRAQELTSLGRPLDALTLLERIPENKTAKKRLEAYVYQIIGRWKDRRGVEYIFRKDGSCTIAGKDGYFGGSGYEITVGDAPYPTQNAYSVVSLRKGTLTLRDRADGSTVRLSYVGDTEDSGEETP